MKFMTLKNFFAGSVLDVKSGRIDMNICSEEMRNKITAHFFFYLRRTRNGTEKSSHFMLRQNVEELLQTFMTK